MIRLTAIHRNFQVGEQQVHALDDVNLYIAPGEYVSIMGPSGSGKSTLLNVIGLLDRPSSGTYVLDGRETTDLGDDELAHTRARQIGFIFQSFHLIPRLTAFENVELPMVLAGIAPAERKQRAQKLLDSLSLADRAHHLPNQLSGGQRQRVAIARAMVMQPTVLLADEPTGNLDHASGEEVLTALEALNNNGITLIVVTHDMEVSNRARRNVRMRDGRIVDDEQRPHPNPPPQAGEGERGSSPSHAEDGAKQIEPSQRKDSLSPYARNGVQQIEPSRREEDSPPPLAGEGREGA